ncbi:hypothetical protein G7046_g2759 [Stylonectria norvegica]|nr:hypothetical protein G7046_g2759 [Stylonectria norvegica]
MVTLDQVEQANNEAPPAGIVAVFAGATAGIGELALKGFTKHTLHPRIYFIGRSQEAGDRLQKELKALNAQGEYNFVKADMSLLKNVDEVCRDIKKRETAINVLLLTQGTLKMGVDTTEGLPYITALTLYSRNRLIANLLPLIQNATSLRRVISVGAGTKEGAIYSDDIQGRKVPFRNARGHLTTTTTFALEALARQAPEVSFINSYPGFVKTNLIRSDDGFMLNIIKNISAVTAAVRNYYVPEHEVEERYAWLSLNDRFPPRAQGKGVEGAAVGSDGTKGSGVYSIDDHGEGTPQKVVALLGKYRNDGMVDKVWAHIEGEFKRITGTSSI